MRPLMRWLVTLVPLLFLGALPAAAQSLEGVLMPGKVIEGHAKFEGDCRNCHVLLDKAAQDRLCLDCHKDVAHDVTGKRGHHGRIRIDNCRSCHTEHKGRAAKRRRNALWQSAAARMMAGDCRYLFRMRGAATRRHPSHHCWRTP